MKLFRRSVSITVVGLGLLLNSTLIFGYNVNTNSYDERDVIIKSYDSLNGGKTDDGLATDLSALTKPVEPIVSDTLNPSVKGTINLASDMIQTVIKVTILSVKTIVNALLGE